MNKRVERLLTISALFVLVSCASPEATSSFNEPSNNEEAYSPTLLRSPEDIAHMKNSTVMGTTSYLAFKEKMRDFSSRLSASYINYDNKNNTICSPLSIELCLGLAFYATANETREEIENAFGIDYETFNYYYKAYFDEILMENKDFEGNIRSRISLTNSLWISNDYDVVTKGLDDLKNDYYCYSYETDFQNHNQESNDAIEDFINEQTHGLIDPELEFNVNTYLVLLNTLYLKDIWNEAGEPIDNAPSSYRFLNSNGEYSTKALLNGYYKDVKSYKGNNYTSCYTSTYDNIKILFMKPDDGYHVKDIFTASNIKEATTMYLYRGIDEEKKERYQTKVIFPEFNAESDLSITEMLYKDFGIHQIFDESCDFSNLSTDNDLYCSDCHHIAKLEVNKKGIEGAAVTYMAMEGKAGAPDEYKEIKETFVVDKEFGYVVLNGSSNIIFSGIITNID